MKVSSAAFAGIKPSVKSSLIRCKKVCIAIFTESAQDFGHQRHVSRWHAHVPGPLSYRQEQDGRYSLQTAPEVDWRPLLDAAHPLILQLPMLGSQSIVANELQSDQVVSFWSPHGQVAIPGGSMPSPLLLVVSLQTWLGISHFVSADGRAKGRFPGNQQLFHQLYFGIRGQCSLQDQCCRMHGPLCHKVQLPKLLLKELASLHCIVGIVRDIMPHHLLCMCKIST